MGELLRWRCGCGDPYPKVMPSVKKRRPEKDTDDNDDKKQDLPKYCPIENILAQPAKRFGGGGMTFTAKCPQLFALSCPTYKNMFSYYPGKNGEKWQNRMSRLYGDSGASSFVPHLAEQHVDRHKTTTTPRVPCQGCVRTIEKGGFETAERVDANAVLWGSGRCPARLCGRCCVDEMCSGHGKCVSCRRTKDKRSAGRGCLAKFGLPCQPSPVEKSEDKTVRGTSTIRSKR